MILHFVAKLFRWPKFTWRSNYLLCGVTIYWHDGFYADVFANRFDSFDCRIANIIHVEWTMTNIVNEWRITSKIVKSHLVYSFNVAPFLCARTQRKNNCRSKDNDFCGGLLFIDAHAHPHNLCIVHTHTNFAVKTVEPLKCQRAHFVIHLF